MPVQSGLDRLLDHLTGAPAVTTTTLFERWGAIVGVTLERHTQPLQIQEGVLTVAVDDPAWASQLRFLESELRQRISTEPGGSRVNRLEFVVRPAGFEGR